MTRDLAGADVRTLASAQDLARDLERELDLAAIDARALAGDVALALDHARGLLERYARRDRAHTLARLRAFERYLVRDIDRAHVLARGLADARDRALTLALYRDLDLDHHARTFGLADALYCALDRARGLARDLDSVRDSHPPPGARPRPRT